MTTLFSDDFNRANSGSLGANWSGLSGWGGTHSVNTNQAQFASPGTDAADYVSAISPPANQWAKATYKSATSDDQSVMIRSNPSGGSKNCYSGGHNANEFGGANTVSRLWKYVAGIVTSLGTGATANASGQIHYVEAFGSQITYKIDGVTQVSVSDGSHASGQVGITGEDASVSVLIYDDFSAGDFIVAPTGRRRLRMMAHVEREDFKTEHDVRSWFRVALA